MIRLVTTIITRIERINKDVMPIRNISHRGGRGRAIVLVCYRHLSELVLRPPKERLDLPPIIDAGGAVGAATTRDTCSTKSRSPAEGSPVCDPQRSVPSTAFLVCGEITTIFHRESQTAGRTFRTLASRLRGRGRSSEHSTRCA